MVRRRLRSVGSPGVPRRALWEAGWPEALTPEEPVRASASQCESQCTLAVKLAALSRSRKLRAQVKVGRPRSIISLSLTNYTTAAFERPRPCGMHAYYL